MHQFIETSWSHRPDSSIRVLKVEKNWKRSLQREKERKKSAFYEHGLLSHTSMYRIGYDYVIPNNQIWMTRRNEMQVCVQGDLLGLLTLYCGGHGEDKSQVWIIYGSYILNHRLCCSYLSYYGYSLIYTSSIEGH